MTAEHALQFLHEFQLLVRGDEGARKGTRYQTQLLELMREYVRGDR